LWEAAKTVMRGRIICLAAAAVQKVYLEYQNKLEKEVNEIKKAT